jgi:hypothetical protein
MVSVLTNQEEVSPQHHTIRGDYLVTEWGDVGRDGFINLGIYDEMIDLVNQFEIDPTILYRGIDRDLDHVHHGTTKGDVIDYTGRLSSWSTEYRVASDFANGDDSVYRLVVTHKIIGLKMLYNRSEHEVILPGHLYTVTSDKEDERCIDVEITD